MLKKKGGGREEDRCGLETLRQMREKQLKEGYPGGLFVRSNPTHNFLDGIFLFVQMYRGR